MRRISACQTTEGGGEHQEMQAPQAERTIRARTSAGQAWGLEAAGKPINLRMEYV